MAVLRFFVVFLLGIGAAIGAYFGGALDYISHGGFGSTISRPWLAPRTPASAIIRIRDDEAGNSACAPRYVVENSSGSQLLVLHSTRQTAGDRAGLRISDFGENGPADAADPRESSGTDGRPPEDATSDRSDYGYPPPRDAYPPANAYASPIPPEVTPPTNPSLQPRPQQENPAPSLSAELTVVAPGERKVLDDSYTNEQVQTGEQGSYGAEPVSCAGTVVVHYSDCATQRRQVCDLHSIDRAGTNKPRGVW